MQFYEKLKFLLNLTQITNRILALKIHVDPSLISRLCTGARGIPRNREHIRAMADCFAAQCSTEYQRQTISQVLGIKQVLTVENEQLSEILYDWLCGSANESGRFARTYESLFLSDPDESGTVTPHSFNTDNAVYYDNNGKRAAARAVYQHLLSLEKPCTIYVLSDETDDWISEDSGFSRGLRSWGLNLLRRGFTLTQIAPPHSSADLAFDSLIRWLPLYMTGRVTAYFYPRVRDGFHRRTLLVVPGEIAMTSNSAAPQRTSSAVILTTDRRLIQSYMAQFQDYLSLCRPMQNIHTEPEPLLQCFTRFLSLDGARIQSTGSLSAETAPPELVAYCVERLSQPDLKKIGDLYLQGPEQINRNIGQHDFVDMGCLADAQDVRDGRVPIIMSSCVNPAPLYYTPETYALHLSNILHMLETCDRYHFVPVRPEAQKSGILMVREGKKALLVRTISPYPMSVFEISQPEVVQLCREYLFQAADAFGYTGTNRLKIISQIKTLIRELQG